ncbi:MAG: hypothetical protein GEV05_05045 [Betaproteobacteria bacterium]|nr:hypothetical protein [Betaproteobacteria bacterium]
MSAPKPSSLHGNRYSGIEVRPLDAALGAEVRCGDLRQASDAQFAQIRQAWLDHLVLVFRGQSLSDEDLIALGRRFGDLDGTIQHRTWYGES